MSQYTLDWNQYRALARTAIAEGAVLLSVLQNYISL